MRVVTQGTRSAAIGETSTPTIFLDPHGITGCYFEVQPLAVFSWPLPPLSGQIALSLPSDPSVVGLELRLQGAVTYPGANAANMLVTRVVHGYLGSR